MRFVVSVFIVNHLVVLLVRPPITLVLISNKVPTEGESQCALVLFVTYLHSGLFRSVLTIDESDRLRVPALTPIIFWE